jgi:hypothetical protein
MVQNRVELYPKVKVALYLNPGHLIAYSGIQ